MGTRRPDPDPLGQRRDLARSRAHDGSHLVQGQMLSGFSASGGSRRGGSGACSAKNNTALASGVDVTAPNWQYRPDGKVQDHRPPVRDSPRIRCAWPAGSRWDGRSTGSGEEAERLKARHEYHCHLGRGQLAGRAAGKTPNHVRIPGHVPAGVPAVGTALAQHPHGGGRRTRAGANGCFASVAVAADRSAYFRALPAGTARATARAAGRRASRVRRRRLRALAQGQTPGDALLLEPVLAAGALPEGEGHRVLAVSRAGPVRTVGTRHDAPA